MSEPVHIKDILPGVMREIERRMRCYSETHPEGLGRGSSAEQNGRKECTGALQSVYEQEKRRMTDGC